MPSNRDTRHMGSIRGPAYKKGKYTHPYHPNTAKPSVGRKPAERFPTGGRAK